MVEPHVIYAILLSFLLFVLYIYLVCLYYDKKIEKADETHTEELIEAFRQGWELGRTCDINKKGGRTCCTRVSS